MRHSPATIATTFVEIAFLGFLLYLVVVPQSTEPAANSSASAATLLPQVGSAPPPPAWTGNLYVSTRFGQIFKIPQGTTTPLLAFSGTPLGNAECLDFDALACEFVVANKPNGIARLSLDFSHTSLTPSIVGGNGCDVDNFTPPINGKRDVVVANFTDGKVYRIRGDGTFAVAANPGAIGFPFPEDVDINDANGDIFVATSNRIVQFNAAGGFIKAIVFPGAPFCMTFDNGDRVPDYEIVASVFFGTIFLVDVDGILPLKAVGPSPGGSCDDICISPTGQLIYPDVVFNRVFAVNLSTGASTFIASIPGAVSCTFVSPNCTQGSFDVCLQDDSSRTIFRFNLTTGDYLLTDCSGLSIGGTGTLIRRGDIVTLQHTAADRRVIARIDLSVRAGTATVQLLSTGRKFTINDRNTANNTCACP